MGLVCSTRRGRSWTVRADDDRRRGGTSRGTDDLRDTCSTIGATKTINLERKLPMRNARAKRWVWYAVLAAVVVGLFAPTMFANAGELVGTPICPAPKM